MQGFEYLFLLLNQDHFHNPYLDPPFIETQASSMITGILDVVDDQ